MVDEDVTMGEVWRKLQAVESNMADGFKRIDRRFEEMAFVRVDVYASDQRQVVGRVNTIEEGLKWLRRTVFAALIAGLAPLIVTLVAIKGGGG